MKQVNYGWITFLLYVLGFLLFWEWLRPLSTITNTGDSNVFVMFTAFAFLLSYLQLPFWITIPAKALAILYALHSLFFFTSIFGPWWISYLFKDIAGNIGLLFVSDWDGLSNLFRSLLFFVLLWLVSYLMHYWLVQARRMFLFFFVTVLYVTVIDTFTVYDADAAIVRTVMIGFVLLGLLRFVQLREGEKVSASRLRFPLSWIIVLAALLFVTTAVGFAAPKVGPQWPDPVPFIKSAAQKYQSGDGGGEAVHRIGYGTNDSRLGGSFIDDDTPVFTATTKGRHYWRVESKDVYTGKGWNNSDKGKWEPLHLDVFSAPDLYSSKVETVKTDVQIKLANNRKFPQLVYGGELVRADVPNNVSLKINDRSEKIRMVSGDNNLSLGEYQLTFEDPRFSIERLRESKADPAFIKKRYLQLPNSLPGRVRKLAKDVTKNADNRYDKAKALESFFNEDQFSYDTKHVAVPGKDDDYVAQFLFDSKQGYCDNFSTSMAVMLRSIGIPTRWVKGFTPGDPRETLANGSEVYQVTNANAHSWVEVYFPQAGWVPFEATKAFIDPFHFVSSYNEEGSESADPSTPENTPKKNEDTPTPQKQLPDEQDENSTLGDGGNSGSEGVTSITFALVSLAVLLILVFICFITRRKWVPLVIRARYKHRSDDRVFLEAYERLLKLLPMYGIVRETNKTLREYATSVDQTLGTHEMKVLTVTYEKARYRGERSAEAWRESKEGWEAIIKRLSS